MTYDLSIAKRVGMNAAITLSALHTEEETQDNEWFTITNADLSYSTGLSPY